MSYLAALLFLYVSILLYIYFVPNNVNDPIMILHSGKGCCKGNPTTAIMFGIQNPHQKSRCK